MTQLVLLRSVYDLMELANYPLIKGLYGKEFGQLSFPKPMC